MRYVIFFIIGKTKVNFSKNNIFYQNLDYAIIQIYFCLRRNGINAALYKKNFTTGLEALY
jgi:hypothetical protein